MARLLLTRRDYHLALADNPPAALSIPAFTWQLYTPPVPAGTGANDVLLDLDGLARTGAGTAGAFSQKKWLCAISKYLDFFGQVKK